MQNFEEKFCRLCLNIIKNESFTDIDESTAQVLEYLLSKLVRKKFAEDEQVLCHDCSVSLFAAYNFKAVCIETEDSISPFVNSDETKLCDLRQIYAMLKRNEHIDNIEKQKVCRLCLNLGTDEFEPLRESEIEMIHEFIPEMNFSSTTNPMLCGDCSKSVRAHSNFIRTCIYAEDRIRCSNDNSLHIKTEEIDVKVEQNCDSLQMEKIWLEGSTKYEPVETDSDHVEDNKDPERDEKPVDVPSEQPSNTEMNACDECDFVTTIKSKLARHRLKHTKSSKTQKYQCNECGYKTYLKACLTRHQLIHKDLSEVTLYECKKCNFATKQKCHLIRHRSTKQHLRKHESEQAVPQELSCDHCSYKTEFKLDFAQHALKHATLYTCKSCQFETRAKRDFNTHQLQHKSLKPYKCDRCNYRTEFEEKLTQHVLKHDLTFKCELCDFQTRHKNNLKSHQAVHGDPLEVPTHKCDDCGYETKRKYQLAKHRLKHKSPSEVTMFKCNACDFQTRYKFKLASHGLRHKNPSEVEMFRCDQCEYETRYKRYLKKHELNHRDPWEVRVHRCDQCKFGTMERAYLVRHMLSHKSVSEVATFDCDECGFKSKYKGNLVIHKAKHRKAERREASE